MRIAIVAESFLPRTNGVSNSVIRAARHLRLRGHDVWIIAPDSFTADAFEDIPVRTVSSIEFPGIRATDIAVVTAESMSTHLRAIAPDVVHLASPFVLGSAAVRATRSLAIPSVAVYQTDVTGFASYYGLAAVSTLAESVIRRIHQRVDLTLAPSSAAEQYLRGLGVTSIARWGRGVDTELFHPRHADSTLRGPSNRLRVGYVGRLAPEKNVSMLAAAARDPLLDVVIIGDGPSRRELEAAMPNAEFTGMLHGSELARQVASLDVLVATGEHETFCQAVQEGMAAGLPVLAPNCGGPRDLITPGVNGHLYEPGNQRNLKRLLDHLLVDPMERLAMGRRARSTVSERTWDSVCDELICHYRAVTAIRAQAAS